MDNSFFDALEYCITKFLRSTAAPETRGYWCDGVLPDSSGAVPFSKTNKRTRQMTLEACVGNDGQGKYRLEVFLGRKAQSRNDRNLDLTECIPKTATPDNFSVDTNTKTICLVLD
ncbi:hypothetical protein [Flavihumibacter petaseus]|uniref:hypothetical protein n=1 Tax=Flavihumibacter petaseus TaxID=549295 RepID=UPI00061CE30E|nr:hypothetical protein [Flavihumibacter petaseus]